MCEKCVGCVKVEKVLEVIWGEIKSLTMLSDKLDDLGDKYFELFKVAENLLQDQRNSIFEEYLRKKVTHGERKNHTGRTAHPVSRAV